MRKVLAIAPYHFLPARSGGHRYIEGWYNALAKHTQLTVISTADNTIANDCPYRVLPLLSNSIFRYSDFTLRATIRDLIQRNQYDLLIWEHPYFAWLANLVKKDTTIPFLLRTHNIEYQRFKSLHKVWWPLLKMYENWSFQIADSISFISEADKSFAISNWNVNPGRCIDIPFGINNNKIPENKTEANHEIRNRYSIPEHESILLFNGPLDYTPNREALEAIIQFVVPSLQTQQHAFKILICGGNAPKSWKFRKTIQQHPYIEAGFVADINKYVMAADLLLNPVQKGGGVKTKIIESISLGTPVLTSVTGAIGIDHNITGKYMNTIQDGAWEQWAPTIINLVHHTSFEQESLTKFFTHYNWEKIIERVLPVLPD